MSGSTPPSPLTGVPFIFDGVPIHARGLALAAVYASAWTPPDGDVNWVKYGHVANCWRRRGFRGFIVWKPDPDIVFVAQLSSFTPDREAVEALAALAMGAVAIPLSIGNYPLALRLPLDGPGLLAFPRRPTRCLRLWPFEGLPAYVETVEGIEVEMRITGTTVDGGDRAYAEAFVGRTHTMKKTVLNRAGKKVKAEVPRQLIFSGDARHVHLARSPLAVKQFTARLMDRLVIFADMRRDVGVQVSRRRLQGRMLARVQVPAAVGDLQFAIRLPQPGGKMLKFVGDYAVP